MKEVKRLRKEVKESELWGKSYPPIKHKNM
jgi:hypothetical protein